MHKQILPMIVAILGCFTGNAWADNSQWTPITTAIEASELATIQQLDPNVHIIDGPATLTFHETFFLPKFGATAGLGFDVPITDFARQTDLLALQDQFAAGFNKLNAAILGANRNAWRGSALAASIVTIAPLDGQSNRLGMNLATINGENAVGFSYIHTRGAVDVNAGVAFAPSDALVRIGFGVSW